MANVFFADASGMDALAGANYAEAASTSGAGWADPKAMFDSATHVLGTGRRALSRHLRHGPSLASTSGPRTPPDAPS